MTRTISAQLRAAVFAEQTHEVFVTLMTISHPTFTQPIRICDDPTLTLPTAGVKGIISQGQEFVFAPFTLQLPAQNDTGVAQAEMTVDNVGEDLMAPLRNATSAVSVRMQLVLASQPDILEMDADNFKLQSVDYDALTVTGSLSLEYYDLEPYPSGRYTPSTAPGIF